VATAIVTASLAVWGLTALTVLWGMAYFRRYPMTRPPLGVMHLGDVAFMLGAIVLIPSLYLALPGWLVTALFAVGSLGLLQLLLEPMVSLPWRRWLPWVVAAALVAADILLARQVGTESLPYLAVNNVVLILTVVAVTNVWAQSGLRARDLAILSGALVIYDLLATSLLPVTNDLIARLAGLPFTPVLAWPLGHEQWLGIGLGDLLFATAGPLVYRKAFGRTAGLVAILIAVAAVGAVVLAGLLGWLPGIFPVMVVLGPLLVAQYLVWIRVTGHERTTAQYLGEDPLPTARAASSGRVRVLEQETISPRDV
jgi:hypothetical protein